MAGSSRLIPRCLGLWFSSLTAIAYACSHIVRAYCFALSATTFLIILRLASLRRIHLWEELLRVPTTMSTRDTASLASTPEGPKQPNKSTDDNRLGKAEVAKDTEALTRFLSRFDSTNPLTASDNFKIPEFCLGRNATKTVRTCRLSTCDQLIAKRDYVVRVFPPVDPKLKYPEGAF